MVGRMGYVPSAPVPSFCHFWRGAAAVALFCSYFVSMRTIYTSIRLDDSQTPAQYFTNEGNTEYGRLPLMPLVRRRTAATGIRVVCFNNCVFFYYYVFNCLVVAVVVVFFIVAIRDVHAELCSSNQPHTHTRTRQHRPMSLCIFRCKCSDKNILIIPTRICMTHCCRLLPINHCFIKST